MLDGVGFVEMEMPNPAFGTEPRVGTYQALSRDVENPDAVFINHEALVATVTDDHANSAVGATTVIVPSTTNGEIEVAGDNDFFMVSLVAGMIYRFETVHGTHRNTQIDLFDTDGTGRLRSNEYSEPGAGVRINFQATVSGDYFVNVSGDRGETGTYLLKVFAFPPDEHANVPEDATPVAVPSTTIGITASHDDPDFFSVDLHAGTKYRFQSILDYPGYSLLTLYDQDGSTELASELSTIDFEFYQDPARRAEIAWVPTQDGTYFLSLKGDEESATGNYVLNVGVTVDDHADTVVGATPVAVPSTTNGRLELAGDEDYFAFIANRGGTYRFEVILDQSNINRLRDSTLTLYGTDGTTQLRFNDNRRSPFGRGSLIEWTAPSDGTYFLKVEGRTSSLTGGYLLDLRRVQQIIDDGDYGFAIESGSWGNGNVGANGDNRNASMFGGMKVARWTFTGLLPGRYRVHATWKADPNRATNAPYTMFDGTTLSNTVNVNQQLEPRSPGFSDLGVPWQNLGRGVNVTSNKLVVKLSNLANGYVMADAIRIERVGDLPPAQIIDDGDPGFAIETGSWGNGNVGANGDNRNASRFGGVKSARWTFTNLRDGLYRVSATWKADPSRATDAPYTIFDRTTRLGTVEVNQQMRPQTAGLTDLGVPWQDLGEGFAITRGTLIVLLSNFADGYVMADAIRIERVGDLPRPMYIDDGDTGFAIESGSWGFGNSGAFGDNRNASSFGGLRVARWTFTGLEPGVYRVSATWTEHPRRATDAPYSIFNGKQLLRTVDVNQQSAPSGTGGYGLNSNFELLGLGFFITGRTLIVKLSNVADGYVMADAIRIQRVGDLPLA